MFFRFLLLAFSCAALSVFPPASAKEPSIRIITTGWNAPTVQQFVRDRDAFTRLPFTGSVIHARADGSPPDPFAAAHSKATWESVKFVDTEAALDTLSPDYASGSYLLLSANPGDVDWLDDNAWSRVVDRWRIAARLAKRGNLRGIVFDPEPYHDPFAQFDAYVQASAPEASFEVLARAARKRGRDVMNAVAAEFPNIEILSYFWMSYFVRDHRYRGPSPVNESGEQREDFQWCLAGHNYGLMPAFLTGLLEASPADAKFVDGCEYGYWLTQREQFTQLAGDVRQRGRMLIDPEVRRKYDNQMRVAFPVFVDLMVPELIPKWTLDPHETDRLGLFRRQLNHAAQSGDGLVWLYSERGRWWPEPKETELWKGKDVYPPWPERLPGCLKTVQDVQEAVQSLEGLETVVVPKLESVNGSVEEFDAGEFDAGKLDAWEFESSPERGGKVAVQQSDVRNANCDEVEFRGVVEAMASRSISVKPGQRYRVNAEVHQSGRGLARMVVRFRDAANQWVTGRGIDAWAFPESGIPTKWRAIRLDVSVPENTTQMIVILHASRQFHLDDRMQFRRLSASLHNQNQRDKESQEDES